MHTLSTEGLISDQRFVEALVRSRRERGFGPVKCAAVLRTKGVEQGLIDAALDFGGPEWLETLHRARSKKFGNLAPATRRELARQVRFFQGRGFTLEQIQRVIREADELVPDGS